AAGGPRALAVHPRAAARAGVRRRGARSRRLPARRAPGARGQAGMSVRLFAGLPLDTGTRATLANLTADVRRTEWPVRWVAPEAWHLTVKFYGEREEAEVGTIGAGLAGAVQGTPPLDLQFTALGANAPGRRARVLWLQVEAPA